MKTSAEQSRNSKRKPLYENGPTVLTKILSEAEQPTILLLSGPVASGKSCVAELLKSKHAFKKVSTGEYLTKLAKERGKQGGRTLLQEMGDELDIETDYTWPVDLAMQQMAGAGGDWLLDAVRKERQVFHFRQRFGLKLFHAHLFAPEHILAQRYKERLANRTKSDDDIPYEVAIQHSNERAARALINIADLKIDTNDLSSEDAAQRIREAQRRTI